MIQYLEERKELKKSAIIYKENDISYEELFNWVRYNQNILEKHQFKMGDTVAFRVTSQFEFVILFLSLAAYGVRILPIPDSVHSSEEARLKERVQYVLLDRDIIEELVNEDNCRNGISNIEFHNKEENTYLIQMTSGSSGRAKLCLKSMKALDADGICGKNTMDMKPEYHMMGLCPLEHALSFGAIFNSWITNGCTLHIVDMFNPRQVLNYMCSHEINVMALIPDMAKVLCSVETEKDGREIMKGMKICMTGTVVVTKEIFNTFYEKFGVKLMNGFGSTETGGAFCRMDDDYTKLGKPVWNVKVKVCDEEGKEVPVGKEGFLYIKSPCMMEGYLDDSTNFDEEGYLTLYDRVVMDETGNFTFVGRNPQIAKINGMKVSLEEVENAILSIEGVKECKVVVQNDVLTAYVAAEKNNHIDFYSELEKRINKNSIPRKFVFKDRFERNSVGKLRLENLMQEDE